MGKIRLTIIIIPFFSFYLSAKSQTGKCNNLHNGTFYYYIPKSTKAFQIIRRNSEQNEINLETKDTSFWKVSWKESCIMNAEFLRTTNVLPEGQINFMKSHTTVVEILAITDEYYIFLGSFEVNGKKMGQIQDTMWLKLKNIVTK